MAVRKKKSTKSRGRSVEQNAALSEATAVELWNQEDEAESGSVKATQLQIVVFSRDWTVETVVSQIRQGNIDLEPDFQRRNAWRDERRSRLIESFILNFPVPQVVLAEHPKKPKSFIVIDGKQRLLTIAGLFIPEYRDYWDRAEFGALELVTSLNGVKLDDFLSKAEFAAQRRQLTNADIRTTVVSDYKSDPVLYNIFYRLNTGSVPLSSQELRQVLNQGGFAKHLLERTEAQNPIREVLGLSGPDSRLRDVELLLRLVAWRTYSREYVGNMKPFLDYVMRELNTHWGAKQDSARRTVDACLDGAQTAVDIFGPNVGRKYKDGRYERAINRAVFEMQALAFTDAKVAKAARAHKTEITRGFEKLCADADFLASLEATTKSIANYRTRFGDYWRMIERVTKLKPASLSIGK